MPVGIARCLIIVFEALVAWLSVQRYAVLSDANPLLHSGQLSVLFAASCGLSVIGLVLSWLSPRRALPVFLLKGLLVAFICMLVPRLDLGMLPFMIAFNLVVGLGSTTLGTILTQGLTIVVIFAFTRIFGIQPNVDPTEMPLFWTSLIVLAALSAGIRGLYQNWRLSANKAKKLADEVEDLAMINVELQSFALTIGSHTLSEERKRLSREIHDTVGYTLTTLKLLFEAAKGLVRQDPEKLEGLFEQGLTYTKTSLDEIRSAMRGLRQSESPSTEGLHLIAKLVDNFRSVTGMKIATDYTNAHRTYSQEIDEVLYKMVQESLTNAYRHGKATAVEIVFQEYRDMLSLMVTDNGVTARNFVKGIGMEGMEERVAALGGTVRFEGTDFGFAVKAEIPVHSGKEEDNGI